MSRPCLLVLMVIGVAALGACGGDDDDDAEELSLEEYFQGLERITVDAEQAIEEAANFELVSAIVLAGIEQLEELTPPEEVGDEHRAYVDALRDYAPLVIEFFEESEGLSAEELLELDASEIEAALMTIDGRCRDLQDVADSEDIDVDLNCEEGSDDDEDDGAAPPENDDRSEARVIEELPYAETIDVSGASSQDDDPRPSCGSTGSNRGSVWYELTIDDEGGPVIVDSEGSDYDTVVAVYEVDESELVEVACNDDAPGLSTSSLRFSAASPSALLIQVVAYGSSSPGRLELEVRRGEAAGENDEPDSATIIELPYSDSLDTSRYTTSGSDPSAACGSESNSSTAWYRVTLADDGVLVVDTFGSTYDTVLAVYEDVGGELTEVACNDDSDIDSIAALSFIAEGGVTYYIQVSSYGGDPGGDLELSVTEGTAQ